MAAIAKLPDVTRVDYEPPAVTRVDCESPAVTKVDCESPDVTRFDCEAPAVTRFREYLRCVAVHPNPDYSSSVEFLRKQAEEIHLDVNVLNPVGDPVVIMTWEGAEPEKESILLNSHMDLVPVFAEHWTYPPFSAHKTEDGRIFARGAQDMKCTAMMYLEAVRRLKEAGRRLNRTVHLTFVPDEEVGGKKGVKAMVETGAFQPLNIGFILDEGTAAGASESVLPVHYAERAMWQFDVVCCGSPGHASRFISNNAAEKFRRILNSFLSFRDEEEKKLKTSPHLILGDVTTVNFTIAAGGIQYNVVPTEFVASFDVRITPHQDLKEFEDKIKHWMTAAGEGVSIKYNLKNLDQSKTDVSSKWCAAFFAALESKNVSSKTQVFRAATDSRHLRAAGFQALGFSYMPRTPVLSHANDEFIEEKVFIDGIGVFEEIITRLGNVN